VEEKLTPAARQAVEEVVQEYRNQLLRLAADRSASYIGDYSEVSVRDILGAMEQLERGSGQRATFASHLLRMYSIVGITVAAGAMSFIALQRYPLESISGTVALGVGIFGLLLALSSYVMRPWIARRGVATRRRYPIAGFEGIPLDVRFVSRWRDIELALRDLVSMRFGESAADQTGLRMAKLLLKAGELTGDQLATLANLLEQRNRIVHEGERVEARTLLGALAEAEAILELLRKKQDLSEPTA